MLRKLILGYGKTYELRGMSFLSINFIYLLGCLILISLYLFKIVWLPLNILTVFILETLFVGYYVIC